MNTHTIPADRLAWLDQVTLDSGSHHSYEEGVCAEEAVAYLAGLGITDSPACASPVLRAFTISLNDTWDTEQRQKLKPFLVAQIGTANDGQDEARSFLALDWLIRTYTPAWLDLAGLTVQAQALRDLDRIVDLVSAEAAGPVVRDGQDTAWAAASTAASTAAGTGASTAAGTGAGTGAGAAAGAAARTAARTAARDAAEAAAEAAARDAAGAAARTAARTAARDAAGAAAQAAVGATLEPTVDTLQASALDLLAAMIDPSAVTA